MGIQEIKKILINGGKNCMTNADLDKLISRYIIKGIIKNTTQLHVGTGEAETEFTPIDNPLIRIKINHEDIPYIPGSSLKGILRTEVEKYYRAIGKDVCYPYNHNSHCNRGNIDELCPACQIFGSQQISSHFIVSDAILQDTEEYPFPGIKIKPGNAINRITGVAQHGALYQVETIQPGGCFKMTIQINNIDLRDDSSELTKGVKYLLRQLKEGWLQVGGKRSSGLGQIELIEAQVTEIKPEHLESLTFPTYPIGELI